MIKDIKHDFNDGFSVSTDGDFVSDFSDTQHVQDIIDGFPGEWNEFPLLGVGIRNQKNSSGNEQMILRKTKLMLSKDGYKIDQIVFKNGKMYVSGKRRFKD